MVLNLIKPEPVRTEMETRILRLNAIVNALLLQKGITAKPVGGLLKAVEDDEPLLELWGNSDPKDKPGFLFRLGLDDKLRKETFTGNLRVVR